MTTLEQLCAYTQWANQRWLDFIARHHSGDAYLLKLIGHVAQGERAWFQRLLGETLDRDVWKPMTLPATRDLFAHNAMLYAQLLRGSLERRIEYVRNNGDTGSASVEDILLHLCTHGGHHRANLASYAVNTLKSHAPQTDFVEYTRCFGPGVIPRE
jgi:uncharacterized damage-inducible protein DinB